jgi:hypothetical protein
MPEVSRLGSTLLSLALAGVLVLAAHADLALMAAAVLLVQVLVAVAPPLTTSTGENVASPRFAPALVAGVVATALTFEPDLLDGAAGTSPDVVGATDTGMLSGVLPGIVAAVFVALAAQMLRKDGRTHLVRSLGYAVLVSVVAAFTAGWLGTAQSLGDAEAVSVGAAGLAAGLVVWLLPLDRWLCVGLATVAGAGGGAAVAAGVDSPMTIFFGVVVVPGRRSWRSWGRSWHGRWQQASSSRPRDGGSREPWRWPSRRRPCTWVVSSSPSRSCGDDVGSTT